MPRPAIDWLITDTHLNHERVITKMGRRPDFQDLFKRNLRQYVAVQDRLFHLGDVIFYHHEHLADFMSIVKCSTKVLVLGNHDSKSPGWYSRNGFSFVCDMVVIGDVLLSHRPVKTLPSGVRINIHGHWHDNDHSAELPWYDKNSHKRLSMEAVDYRPVDLRVFAGPQVLSHRHFKLPTNGENRDEPEYQHADAGQVVQQGEAGGAGETRSLS